MISSAGSPRKGNQARGSEHPSPVAAALRQWWLTALAVAVVAAGFAIFYGWELGQFAAGWVLALATGAFLAQPLTVRGHAIRVGLLAGAVIVGVGACALRIARVLDDPGAWDFLCYYLDGKVVLSGLDPYQPDSHRSVFSTFETRVPLDQGFVDGVLNVGMKYPPPSMLLVAPFALFSFDVGLALWMVLVVVLPASLSAVLLARALPRLPGEGHHALMAALFAVALVTLSPGGAQTVATQQTLYGCLLVLLLMQRLDRSWLAGVVASVGFMFKTMLVFAPLYLLVSGRLRAFVASALTLAALFFGAWLLVGSQPIQSYLTSDWVDRVPLFEYSQEINQSLLAVLIRADGDPTTHPLDRLDFVVVGSLIAVITFFAVVSARLRRRDELVLALAVAGSLLVYPGVLRSYGVLLLIPLMTLFSLYCGQLKGPRPLSRVVAIALLAGCIFALEHVHPFSATLIVWMTLVATAFIAPRAPASHPPAPGPSARG